MLDATIAEPPSRRLADDPLDSGVGEVTALLEDWVAGRKAAQDPLFRLVYPELRRLASRRLRKSAPGLTLQPTELVHEAYLRLVDQRRVSWRCRAHFFAIAAQMMRRIAADQMKHRRRLKRGGDAIHLAIDGLELGQAAPMVDCLALDQALTRLAAINVRAARVVELRCFAGLSLEEAAAVLHLGRATVVRSWRFARAWLGQYFAHVPRPG